MVLLRNFYQASRAFFSAKAAAKKFLSLKVEIEIYGKDCPRLKEKQNNRVKLLGISEGNISSLSDCSFLAVVYDNTELMKQRGKRCLLGEFYF